MNRRNFLAGILASAVAPAFIKTAGLLMPIKPQVSQWVWTVPEQALPVGWEAARQGALYTVKFVFDGEVSLAS